MTRLQRWCVAATAAALSISVGVPPAGGQQAATGVASQKALLNQYCVTCHNEKLKSGGLVVDKLDLDHVANDADSWEKIVRKVRSGMMPPAGMKRPDRPTLDAFATALESSLDRAAAAQPNPGVPSLHRMNRSEYGNAIRDLLAVDIDPAAYLPSDDSSNGFDNISEALGVSPALMERYVTAAAKISRIAVGDPGTSTLATTYKVRGDLTQTDTIEGLPPGTRGGILIHHTFPLDGDYDLKAALLKLYFGPIFAGAAAGEELEVSVNGVRVKLFKLDPVEYSFMRVAAPQTPQSGELPPAASNNAAQPRVIAVGDSPEEQHVTMSPNAKLELRLKMSAGPATIAVTFLKKTSAPVDDIVNRPSASTRDTDLGVQFGYTSVPHLASVEIVGPYNATGPGATPSRGKIFTCKPTLDREDVPCAKQILSNLVRRAYRRPPTTADLETLLNFYQTARSKGTFDQGIELALRRILADPDFVFRVETDPVGVAPSGVYRVSNIELASRLSFFLWSSIPDDELLNLAAQGLLKDPAVLRQQTLRMLKDRKARALVNNFAAQWLFLRELKKVSPDAGAYPDFDDNLRQAFQRETEMLFESVVRDDRSVLDLLNADYTFVNERLARHYGIPNIIGPDFRRVPAPEARRGLLGQGSMLLVTSTANRTSPVQRGKWILENILGSPPPLPPPDVPPLQETTIGAVGPSVRERLIEHRANPVCASCHKIMDPIGLALEFFDGVGKWRDSESGTKIDAAGQLVDGTPIDGPISLRQALVRNYSDAFERTLIEKLLMYGLGRELHAYDMPVVRSIAREASRGGHRFSSVVLGIVNSAPFQMRVKKGEALAAR